MAGEASRDPGLIRLDGGRTAPETELRGYAAADDRAAWLMMPRNHQPAFQAPSGAEPEVRSFAIHPAVPDGLSDAELRGQSLGRPADMRRVSGYLAIIATISAIVTMAILGAHALSSSSPARHHAPVGSVGSSIRSAGSSVKVQTATSAASSDNNGAAN